MDNRLKQLAIGVGIGAALAVAVRSLSKPVVPQRQYHGAALTGRKGVPSGGPHDDHALKRPPAAVDGRPAAFPHDIAASHARGARTDLPPFQTKRLFGVSVADLDADEVIARIIALSKTPPARTVVTTNLDHARKLRRDPGFRRAYREADIVTADGTPFVWLSSLEGEPLKGKVTGSDLIKPLARAAAQDGRSLFLFGSTLTRIHAAAKALKDEIPTLELRGAYAPPMGFERDPMIQRELLELFRTARPDIVLVALGAPKQEIWANGMANAVRHGVFVSVGASLDYLSGDMPRAPRAFNALGLEWLWRFVREPFRLGPRYLGILFSLPGLYAMHQRDRAEHYADEERRAMAALTDERLADARAAAQASDTEQRILTARQDTHADAAGDAMSARPLQPADR